MSLARIVVSLAAGVLLLAPSAPPAHAGGKALRCAFAKQRAVVRKIEAVLECQREALRIGASVDPACVAAADANLTAAFERAEMRGGCRPEGDAPVFQAVADLCSTRIVTPLQGTCTEQGEECGSGAPPCCTGLVCKGSVRGGPPVCSF
jgi:hypothetical protein